MDEEKVKLIFETALKHDVNEEFLSYAVWHAGHGLEGDCQIPSHIINTIHRLSKDGAAKGMSEDEIIDWLYSHIKVYPVIVIEFCDDKYSLTTNDKGKLQISKFGVLK